MILRSLLATSTLVAATAALSACAGGPIGPPNPTQVAEATYVCDSGERLTARFEYGSQRTLFLGTADLDGRVLSAPKNAVVVIADNSPPVRMEQGPSWTDTGFDYHADGGYRLTGDAGRVILTTPAGMQFCRTG
jgi:hypothetical protein